MNFCETLFDLYDLVTENFHAVSLRNRRVREKHGDVSRSMDSFREINFREIDGIRFTQAHPWDLQKKGQNGG